MGFKHEEYMNMTWKEFDYYYIGYLRRIERNWDYVRNIIAAQYNSSGFSKKHVKATDIISLRYLDDVKEIKTEKIDFNHFKDIIKKRNINAN